MSDFTEFSGSILESDDSRFLNFDILYMANGGKEIEVEIQKVIKAKPGSKFENGQPIKSKFPIIVFKGEGVVTRRLWYVRQKSNRNKIGKLLGQDPKNWAGGKITLFPDPNVRWAGEKVGGIVVKSR